MLLCVAASGMGEGILGWWQLQHFGTATTKNTKEKEGLHFLDVDRKGKLTSEMDLKWRRRASLTSLSKCPTGVIFENKRDTPLQLRV